MVKITFTRKHTEAGNATTFIFEPQKPVTWEAGQYTSIELPNLPPSQNEHTFTISAPPYKKYFTVTTRVSDSAFKQKLNSLDYGTVLEADQVGGDFTWTDTDRHVVFVAGGIGITPYHSILMQRDHKNKPLNITLLYANRDDNIVFKAELDKLAATHPEFGVHYLIGERLTATKMKELVPQLLDCLVYVSGPEPMVDAFEVQLRELGLPKDQIKQDWFPGYTEKNY